MWGLVFVAPSMLPQYPAALLSFARYLAFGLIAVPLAWFDQAGLRRLGVSDWIEAFKLSAIGNLLYYVFLAAAIQRAGGPLPTMIIGTLPVVISIASNLRDAGRDGKLPWARLLPSLGLIALGIGCVNQAELAHFRADPDADLGRYLAGALFAVAAVACWTWYPLRNADWLRGDSRGGEGGATTSRNPRTWATAQGVTTLPLAALGFAGFWVWNSVTGASFDMPLGPTPGRFIALMFAVGLFASWLGTLCWNEASQRLPTALVGQLIVFETLSALSFAYVLRGQWPDALTLFGVVLLVAGVLWALRVRPEPIAAAAHPN
jgi:drug/metabolite transporter (DMT)-like permease